MLCMGGEIGRQLKTAVKRGLSRELYDYKAMVYMLEKGMIFFGHTRVITPFTEGERCSMASLTGETLHIIKINKETHATIFVSFSSSSSSGQKYAQILWTNTVFKNDSKILVLQRS